MQLFPLALQYILLALCIYSLSRKVYKHSWWQHAIFLQIERGGGPRVVVSTAAFHAGVRGSVPGLGGLKETKLFLPHPRVKVSIVGSLRDREVACSASDRQGSNFESCVWRTVSSQSSHHPQEVLLAQFSLYVHKGGLKPDSFHFISNWTLVQFGISAVIRIEPCFSMNDTERENTCALYSHPMSTTIQSFLIRFSRRPIHFYSEWYLWINIILTAQCLFSLQHVTCLTRSARVMNIDIYKYVVPNDTNKLWVIFTHLMLCVAVATHNFKWVKI